MAEVRIGEFVSYRNNLIDLHESMKVYLWDCGPERPVAPKRPVPPKGQQGDAAYDLACVEFKEQIENYETALVRHKHDLEQFTRWWTTYGGPIEIQQWSCDARDTFRHDGRAVQEGRQEKPRYFLSSRTRGYATLPNGGLPHGLEPGHGHAAALERQLEDSAAAQRARDSDPVFGINT